MGIELPSELSGVAAKAGVQWPQADEDAMRASAQAFRQAGSKLSTVATSADGSAHGALKSISGSTADAAQQHWNTFVAPDSGHFTATVQGCNTAADRLEHAADQVGAAKVQIVGHLSDLAKTSDAAEQAAAAGHPTAMLGLDTAIRGTAANVANVNSSLTQSIRLDSGKNMSSSTPPVNATPGAGAHGMFGSVVDSATGLGQTAAHAGGGAVDSLAGMGQGAVHQGVGAVDNLTGGAAAPVLNPVGHGAQSTIGAVGGGADAGLQQTGQQVGNWGHGVDQGIGGHGGPPAPIQASQPNYGGGVSGYGGGLPIPGSPGHGGVDIGPGENTGPIQIQHPSGGGGGPVLGSAPASGWTHGGGGDVTSGAPTPPLGTVQQSAAAPVLDSPPAVGAPQAGLSAAPISSAPVQGGFTAAPAFDAPLSSGGAAGFAGGAAVGGIPAGGAVTGGGGGGWSGGSAPAAPIQRYGSSAGAGGADLIGTVNVPPGGSASARRGMAPGARSAAVNQDADSGASVVQPKVSRPSHRQDPVVALFLVHMFPIGHLPVASSRPMRQLPAPPREHDFASGLYFGPNDHPRADLIRVEPVAGPPQIGPGLPPDHPAVAGLLAGYDPIAGENERDWDRRYLVRPAEDGAAAEYVWPPGEVFPEGGCDTGEAVVLDEGTLIDRFGTHEGRVFAESGTPFGRRALPPDLVDAGYARYRVLRPIPVWRTLSAAWFGQSGAGVRYRATYPAADLITLGYLAEEPIEEQPTENRES
jgi:hypothetical protein